MKYHFNCRFGWYSGTHYALDKGAVALLPEATPGERAWKNFLQQPDNMEAILDADTGEDQIPYRKGPTHFIHTSSRTNTPEWRTLYTRPGNALWKATQAHLNPSQVKADLAVLKQTPLHMNITADQLPSDLLAGQGIAANRVLSQLQIVKAGYPILDNNRSDTLVRRQRAVAFAKLTLLHDIGRLAHLMGDATLPNHTASSNSDWPLESTTAEQPLKPVQGVHAAIEKSALDPTLLNSLSTPTDPLITNPFAPVASKEEIEAQMGPLAGRQIVESYRLLGNVVHTYQSAPATFITALKPILLTHLQQGQKRMAAMLYGLWKLAGEPDVEACFDAKYQNLHPPIKTS